MKGVEYALRAVASLKERSVPVHLDVIGDGPLYESLVELQQTLRVEDATTMHGALAHEAVVTLILQENRMSSSNWS